jgi:hypothetical protein
MADAKIISQEEFEAISSDLAQFIGKMEKLEKSFDPKKLRIEIVAEMKKAMNEKSIFKALENESWELEENLIQLKGVKREFFECKRKSEIMIIIVGFGGLITGGLFVLLILKILGKI